MRIPIKFPSETAWILEDVATFRALSPEERLECFRGLVNAGERMPRHSRNANWLEPFTPQLISFDNDPEPWPGQSSDTGGGVMVVKALTLSPQRCPVIIHSSNRTRSEWMAGDFELAGWNYGRVAPIGERWIEEYWRVVAREVLRVPM